MIAIKNERELALMRQACKITAAARALAGEMVRPGVTTSTPLKNYSFGCSSGVEPRSFTSNLQSRLRTLYTQ